MIKMVLLPLLVGLACTGFPLASLAATLEPTPDPELQSLRQAAQAAASREATPAERPTETIFRSGSLGLQKLNPEISVTGDMLGIYQSGNENLPAWDTTVRSMGMHFEAYLDPYSRFKAAIPLSDEGAELEEVYFTRYGFLGGINLTLGKFKQEFGVVNRWHKHALDTFDYPLALTRIFSGEGLNETGVSLATDFSALGLVNGLTLQVTDGDNPMLFAGNTKNRPAILGHYKLYRDLSPSTYLELGGSGLFGWNDTWAVRDSMAEDPEPVVVSDQRLSTNVYGLDLTLLWEPTSNMRYRNFQWRSEAYFMDKEILTPYGPGTDHLKPWGFYSLAQAKVSRTFEIGARYDYFQPEARAYAGVDDAPFSPLQVVTGSDPDRQMISGWVTWWQSPFVKFRAGYAHESGNETGPDIDSVAFQMVFAAGPHKHDRY